MAVSGVGPVEPGEGTRARDTAEAESVVVASRPRGRLERWYDGHRRTALGAVLAAALVVTGGYVYLTRPHRPPPPAPPYPSQVVDITYRKPVTGPKDGPPRSFSFTVELSVASGPPVTVRQVTQPYAGLSVTTTPRAPFRTAAGMNRTMVITMHVTQCQKVPDDAGLPFLDVTLRNARAIEVHSFILGQRYAQHLSDALAAVCHPRTA